MTDERIAELREKHTGVLLINGTELPVLILETARKDVRECLDTIEQLQKEVYSLSNEIDTIMHEHEQELQDRDRDRW